MLAPPRTGTRVATRRLVSLDVLRGIAVVGMLLVNNPGDRATTPGPLRHSAGNGLTPADLVFPLFLVAVGISMALSRRTAHPRSVARRAALIWLVGVALTTVKYHHVVLSGVLQHVAIAYVVGWLVLRLPRRWQLAGCAALLAGAWAAQAPAVASGADVAGGALLGRAIVGRHLPGLVRLRLFGWAAGAGVAGALLALAVTVNKQLWSPSYAVLAFAISAALLLVVQEAVHRRGLSWAGRRVVELGENPIAVYVVLHLLTYTVFRAARPVVMRLLVPPLGVTAAGVSYSMLVVALAAGFAYGLRRKGIVVRI